MWIEGGDCAGSGADPLSDVKYVCMPCRHAIANVIPFIAGEEEKIETEPNLLVEPYQGFPIKISATATRVPVLHGHTATISMELNHKATEEEIIQCWRDYRGLSQKMGLHLAASTPIVYSERDDFPQPRVEVEKEGGMSISIGRLRKCPILDYKFVMVSHNLILGAAGTSVQIAEMEARSFLHV